MGFFSSERQSAASLLAQLPGTTTRRNAPYGVVCSITSLVFVRSPAKPCPRRPRPPRESPGAELLFAHVLMPQSGNESRAPLPYSNSPVLPPAAPTAPTACWPSHHDCTDSGDNPIVYVLAPNLSSYPHLSTETDDPSQLVAPRRSSPSRLWSPLWRRATPTNCGTAVTRTRTTIWTTY